MIKKNNFLKNKSVLITGGTGSFGKKLVNRLINSEYGIKKIIIFSRDEFKQSEMQKLFTKNEKKKLRFFIGDIRDKSRLQIALDGVDIVVHAAALKQVDTAEYNPQEFIKTNIIGANNLIECCLNSSVEKLLALSTDKAVNPINLYGATKLVSDKLFIAANNLVGDRNLKFSVVRYGNVLSSRGSFVPLLKNLSKDKVATIPITHKDMTRFWITLKESVDLVEKGLLIMKGGEIFIPKIPSVRVIDLPKVICPKNKIKIVGIRPGEKIHEILCPSENAHETIEFKNHFIIKPTIKITNREIDYINYSDEKGKKVAVNFEYSSGSNKKFLNPTQIKESLNNFDD
jgi:UDP-N-acetylglucosamine 4,6-dehydratase/5-epimerase